MRKIHWKWSISATVIFGLYSTYMENDSKFQEGTGIAWGLLRLPRVTSHQGRRQSSKTQENEYWGRWPSMVILTTLDYQFVHNLTFRIYLNFSSIMKMWIFCMRWIFSERGGGSEFSGTRDYMRQFLFSILAQLFFCSFSVSLYHLLIAPGFTQKYS